MKPERWQRVEELYHATLERPAESRADFLRSACGNDEDLYREVESLLGFKSQAENFIEQPALEVAAKAVAADSGTSVIGKQISNYKILSLLGQGGMGEVYLAEDTKLGRKVALKFLPSYSAANRDRLRRFEQEARTASALNHPNILTIHEIGEADGRRFIATEFIDGETLRRRMTNGRMKPSEALNIAIQTADALCAAHEVGIVHRDIKPENVMLRRRDGIVKVLDFGLAKLSEQPAATIDIEASTKALLKTDPGVVMGTVIYMSPEQARGLEVDQRTDIWSLGVVLYEMVAGCLPFEAATASEGLAALLSEKEPPPLARFAREVPAELERIVEKALRKERDERYQVSKEMLLDLKSLKRRLEFEADLERSAAPQTDAPDVVVSSGEQSPEETAPQPATNGGLLTAPPTTSAEYLVNEIKQHKRGLAAVLGALVLTFAALTYFYFARSSKTTSIDSLAVLPFVNVGADPNTEYLSDGITDNIINRLSQLPNLKVMSHSSVFRYKGKETDALAIRRDLGVAAVLTGRVVRRGDDLSINVELVDARDNSHIWGEQYDRKIADVLGLQREIPVDISEKLRLQLSGDSKERLARAYTDNAEAYQLYLKGRISWEKWTLDGAKKAIDYFQEAINKDPNYALAYSGLADVYVFGSNAGAGLPPKEAHRRAREAATKALTLDPALGEAHASLSQVLFYDDWDFTGTERELKRAIELSPSYAEAHHMYSHFLLAMGRIDESLRESEKFLELDPLSPDPNLHLGYHYLFSRQYDKAIAQYKKTLQMDPNNVEAHNQLGLTYYQKEMFTEAVEEFLKARMLGGATQEDIAASKEGFAKSGIKGYLETRIVQLKAGGQPEQNAVNIALFYARLGEKDQEFEWLEKAYAEHSRDLVHVRENLAFDSVRSDPRFADLLRRIGLPQ